MNKLHIEKTDWRIEHKEVMKKFLLSLNSSVLKDSFVLKGGTALLFCYNLDRFSEDLDFDGISDILKFGEVFCNKNGFSFNLKKSTPTTQRFMIKYNEDEEQHPLKIECSYRQKNLSKEHSVVVSGIRTYPIQRLFLQKIQAYTGRDKVRDLYDVSFIINNFYDILSDENKFLAIDALSAKGLEHFDYLYINDQDHLIDYDKLAENFLKTFELLGLSTEKEDEDQVEETENNQPGFDG